MKKEFLCTMSIIVLFTIFNSCSKQSQESDDQSLSTQRVGNNRQGVVYIESNAAQQNSIITYFQNSNGTLTYFATTASGGDGTGSLLGSQGALTLDETHHWLYAVNAGSNSISVFTINDDGSLVLTQTISSYGTRPVSVAVFGWWLYVVNSGNGNIGGFNINSSNGTLTYISGSNQSLSSATASPAEIEFTPDRKLIVSEKNTNKLITFPVTTSGMAQSPSYTSSLMPTPSGFAVSGNCIVVAHSSNGVSNISTIGSYNFASVNTGGSGNSGALSPACSPVCNEQTNASGVAATKDGHYAYITNFGSNTISSFEVGSDGSLHMMKNVEATTGNAPADVVFSNNESYLYSINSSSHTISEYKKSPSGRLSLIGEIGGLPAYAAGLVAL